MICLRLTGLARDRACIQIQATCLPLQHAQTSTICVCISSDEKHCPESVLAFHVPPCPVRKISRSVLFLSSSPVSSLCTIFEKTKLFLYMCRGIYGGIPRLYAVRTNNPVERPLTYKQHLLASPGNPIGNPIGT